MGEDSVLSAIGSTEPSSFSEFCRALKDCPMKGDVAGWREVFETLERLERQGLVVVERQGRSIESLILTDTGADRIRAKLDAGRGLFASF
jgi:DNA-binding transcriptional ArsR family regulator